MEQRNKIIGNLSKNTLHEFNIFKAVGGFRNSENTIKFLLECGEEHIKNSKIKEELKQE